MQNTKLLLQIQILYKYKHNTSDEEMWLNLVTFSKIKNTMSGNKTELPHIQPFKMWNEILVSFWITSSFLSVQ